MVEVSAISEANKKRQQQTQPTETTSSKIGGGGNGHGTMTDCFGHEPESFWYSLPTYHRHWWSLAVLLDFSIAWLSWFALLCLVGVDFHVLAFFCTTSFCYFPVALSVFFLLFGFSFCVHACSCSHWCNVLIKKWWWWW